MAKETKAPKGLWNNFEISGNNATRKNKSCPKCGAGTFMAKHSNRWTCGQCHYTVFESQSK